MPIQKITELALEESSTASKTRAIVESDGKARRITMDEFAKLVKAVLSLDTSYVTAAKLREMYPNLIKTIEAGKNDAGEDGIVITYWNDSDDFIKVASESESTGLAFNGMRQDPTTGLVYLTLDGVDLPESVFTPAAISGGGTSAGGSRLVFAMLSAASFSVLQSAGTAPVRFKFESYDSETEIPTGNGTLVLTVNNVERETISVAQGENSIDPFQYLTMGSNTVQLTLTDGYGRSATRSVSITMDTFTLEWNLGATEQTSEALSVQITPTGNGKKTIYLELDDDPYTSATVSTSGRKLSYSLDLSPGIHKIKAYGTMISGGSTMQSDALTSIVVKVAAGAEKPLIAVNLPSTEAEQYSTIAIPHRVIDPANNPATVRYYVGGVLYDTQQLDQAEHVWSYRPTTPGTLQLSIVCGSEAWAENITVTGLSVDVEEVSGTDLALKLDPTIMTSLTEWAYGNTRLTLSDGFDTHNGGLTTDDEGIRCIRVVKGDRLNIGYKLFGEDARRTGLEWKMIYKVENCSKINATAISCMSNGIGLEIRANDVEVKSENMDVTYPLCEDERTELECNISSISGDRFLMLWESGTPAQAKRYSLSNENFGQTNPSDIIVGSDDCDVLLYLVRVYTRDLTKEEVKANFIVDGKDANEIKSRHERNQVYDSTGRLDGELIAQKNPGARVITWHAPNVSTGKDKKVTGRLTHRFVSGGKQHNWTAYNVTDKAQGTSSLGYIDAGCNQDFSFPGGIYLEDGTHLDVYAMTESSIGVNYLNYKTNVASQEHINNILISEWINRFQPYKRPARVADPRVRDTVEGHICIMLFHNTGDEPVQVGPNLVQPDETIFYSLGCLNNSKKNLAVFGQDEEDDIYSIEIRNNIDLQCRFKSDDLSNEDWSGDKSFEFRHIADGVDEDEAKANLQRLLTWFVSVDYTQAKNTPLPESKTYNGVTYNIDTAEYRDAKFKAELADYFIVDTTTYHYVVTLFFSQVDNRSKNVFLAWSKKLQRWHLCFAYDNDTALGIDNEGDLRLKYGYLDTDSIGTRDVFNAADNVLFTGLRRNFATELRNMYIQLENAGMFDVEAFAAFCDAEQSKVCESVWIEDAYRKSIDTELVLGNDSFVKMLNGKKRLQRRQFLKFQQAFMSSYWRSPYSVSHSATIRGYTPSTYAGVTPRSTITITPYCDMFVTFTVGSENFTEKGYAGQPVTIPFLDKVLTNTEMYARNADMIQAFGSLAQLYPGYIDLSPCRRLERAELGSSVLGYKNTNLESVSVTNAKSLVYFNAEGCPNYKEQLDLSNNIHVREVYTRGSGVTGVVFADWGRLVTAKLNAVASIYAHSLHNVEEFTLDGYGNIKGLNIVDSPAIDTYSMAAGATGIERVRLLDIDWKNVPVSAYDALMSLYNAAGIDDEGYTTLAHGVVTGSVAFTSISNEKKETLEATFKNSITFTYGALLSEYTVLFQNYDGTYLYSEMVEQGGTARDPVATGRIERPTRPADETYSYTYYAWDKALTNITEDTIVTAQYLTTEKTYRVLWVDRVGTVVQENTVKAHGSCSYQGDDLASDDSNIWVGWKSDASDVVSDMTIQADYVTPVLPSAAKDMSLYDYAFSEDPTDSMAYSRDEFAGIVKSSKFKNYLAAGDLVKIIPQGRTITNASVTYKITGFNHLRIANSDAELESEDGAFAKIALFPTASLGPTRAFFNETTNVGGYIGSNIDNFCVELEAILSPFMRSLVPSVVIRANAGGSAGAEAEIKKARRKFFLYSIGELGFNVTTAPYNKEVDSGAESVQMQYFSSNDNRKIGVDYWSRSARADGSVAFWYCNSNGNVNNNNYANGDVAKAVPAGICLS